MGVVTSVIAATRDRRAAAIAAIGKIQITSGVVTIGRADARGVQPAAGDFIYEGDVIETGADGLIGIVFIDGTTFHLYANSRIVLDRFNFGADLSSHAARLRASKGKFGLMAGRIAAAGRFVIDTPLSKIRSMPPVAGVASLGFMFLLCLIDDLKASSESETLWLVDGGTITYKDFEHGVFELVTKDGQHIIVDDPGQTIILHPTGSGVGIEHISNDRAQIVALEDVYQRAYATFVAGPSGSVSAKADQDQFGSRVGHAVSQRLQSVSRIATGLALPADLYAAAERFDNDRQYDCAAAGGAGRRDRRRDLHGAAAGQQCANRAGLSGAEQCRRIPTIFFSTSRFRRTKS